MSLQVTETRHRPLRFEIETESRHRIDVIDTDGIALYRSFWSELPRVHQVDIEPATHTEFTWSVRPLVRIATADPSHHYHRSLYDPIAADVVETSFGGHLVHRLEAARAAARARRCRAPALARMVLDTPEEADTFIDLLEETGTTLVWTQHNLRPHREVERAEELYQRFASAARVVIHHSQWGRDAVLARYRFRADAKHVVLPHGHFGSLIDITAAARDAAEQALGLEPCAIAHRHRRCPPPGEADRARSWRRSRPPIGPTCSCSYSRWTTKRCRTIPASRPGPMTSSARDEYNRRLAAVDVIALPFDPKGEMLTTGVVGDVVGLGLPAIVSSWPYLTESLGAAGLVYDDYEHLVRLLDSLTEDDLAPARRASRALQDELAWDHIAVQFLDAVIDTGAIKS